MRIAWVAVDDPHILETLLISRLPRRLMCSDAEPKRDKILMGTVFRKWRLMSEKTVKEVAKEIGIFHGIIRIKRGYPCDGATLVKIMAWLFGKENK